MKKFLLYLLPFIVLMGIALAVRYQLVYDPRYTLYAYAPKNISGKWVVVGDSKSMFGININDPDIPFVNLSAWGAYPYDNLKAMQEYHLSDNTVFVQVSSRAFLPEDTSNAVINPALVHKLFDFNAYTHYRKQRQHKDKGPWEYTMNSNGSYTYINLTRSYKAYDWKADSLHHVALLHHEKRDQIRETKLRHLQSLITLLRQSNTVYLINLPEREPFETLCRAYEKKLHADILQRCGIAVHDFGVFPDSLFYDSHHMNAKGQRQFSETFKQYIESIKASSPKGKMP